MMACSFVNLKSLRSSKAGRRAGQTKMPRDARPESVLEGLRLACVLQRI